MSWSFFCTQPSSNTNVLAMFRCISVHSSFVFLRKKARASPSQILLQFFMLVLCCPLLPLDCPGLLPFGHTRLMSISSVAFKYQGVPMRPLDTQITGLAHHRSSSTSHLPPHLNFSKPASSRLLFVHDAIFRCRLLLPSTAWPRWRVPPLLRGHMLP